MKDHGYCIRSGAQRGPVTEDMTFPPGHVSYDVGELEWEDGHVMSYALYRGPDWRAGWVAVVKSPGEYSDGDLARRTVDHMIGSLDSPGLSYRRELYGVPDGYQLKRTGRVQLCDGNTRAYSIRAVTE